MRNLIFFFILFSIFFPILPAYSQEISWDRPLYGIGEVGVVTLDNNDANKNPARIDLTQVWIYSDSDPGGLQLLVVETGSNTGLFKGEIDFGNVTGNSILGVTSGDVINAKYQSLAATAKIQGIVSDFTLQTGATSYQKGENVKIEGSISNKKYDPNLLVVVEILNPLGKVIFNSQNYPTVQGAYAMSAPTGSPLWRTGNYTVMAQYGSMKAETSFSYLDEKEDSSGIDLNEEHVTPWGLAAQVVSSSQIQLMWNPPTQTFGLEIIGYNINEKIGSGMYKEITTTNDSTSFILSGLEMGKTYNFVVQARYSTVISEPSEVVSVSIPTIEKPNSIVSDSSISENTVIPDWVRNNAGWWAKGSIEDSDFISGIQFLIKEEIITIPNTSESHSESSDEIPSWIKNNADWWSKGLISDFDFVKGIQYLMDNGIIIVTEPKNQPPIVSIKSPENGSSFEQGTLLSFSVNATDPEDGKLTSTSSIFWSSTLDGTIGFGSSFSKSSLSVGTHFITVRATDSEGLFAAETITIYITGRR